LQTGWVTTIKKIFWDFLRCEYFKQRNKHAHLVDGKKLAFLRKLNEAIENGHVLDCKKFEMLKQEHNTIPSMNASIVPLIRPSK
jgi:hypothetical protein